MSQIKNGFKITEIHGNQGVMCKMPEQNKILGVSLASLFNVQKKEKV